MYCSNINALPSLPCIKIMALCTSRAQAHLCLIRYCSLWSFNGVFMGMYPWNPIKTLEWAISDQAQVYLWSRVPMTIKISWFSGDWQWYHYHWWLKLMMVIIILLLSVKDQGAILIHNWFGHESWQIFFINHYYHIETLLTLICATCKKYYY